MRLDAVQIADFRCIAAASLRFDPRLNLIVGPNASGKTSLLEALYFLGRGRSFRTHQNAGLIRRGAERLQVAGQIVRGERVHRLGVEFGRSGFRLRRDGADARRLSELAETLAVQAVDPLVHELVGGPPDGRRRFLDWGVFHVEHRYLEAWRRYQRALKQRNAALRTGQRGEGLAPWTVALAETGAAVDAARRRYVEALGATLSAVMATLLPDLELELRYWPGWSGERSLEAALTQSLVRDEAAGTTQVGPHRADLLLQDAHGPVREHVSRGQQKLLAAALVLAQLERFQADRGEAGVLLLDDPAAELDAEFLRRLMDRVLQMPVQLFMTGLDTAGLPLERPHRLFHVEHGTITRPA